MDNCYQHSKIHKGTRIIENLAMILDCFPCVRAVNEQLGKGSVRLSPLWDSTDDAGTECLWVTFSEFRRASASPEGREPSLAGAAMTTYFRHVMLRIRAEMC